MTPIFAPGQKKAILFDMNGTLMDNHATRKIAFIKTLNEFTARWAGGNDVSPEAVYTLYLKSLRKAKGRAKTDASEINHLREAFSAMPFAVHDGFIRSFLDRFRQIREHSAEPFRNAHKVLKKLSQSYKLAIVTNGSRDRRLRQYRQLAISGFIPEDRLFTPLNGKGRKPDPAFFRHVLRRMGNTPEQCVMVGDSWRKDIIGAIRSGMDAVWINRAKKDMSMTRSGKSTIIIVHRCERLTDLFG